MNSYEQKILDEVKAKGLISKGETDRILKKLKNIEGSLEAILLEDPKISSQDILSIKAKLGPLPPFEPEDAEKRLSLDLLREISEEAARQYKIVPLEKIGNTLKVGMMSPQDYNARDAIRFISIGGNLTVELYVITYETFRIILGQYRTFRSQIKEALSQIEEGRKDEKKSVKTRTAEVTMKEAPVTKVVAVILKHAVEGNASDIHIEAGPVRTRVRFRVYGQLFTSLFLPSNIHASIVSRIKILSNLKLDETRIPQDGRFSADFNGSSIDFRVSTFPTKDGEKVVLRVLDPTISIREFSKLGLVGRNLDIVKQVSQRPYGMILLSGPTGSGKSSTLYAALHNINTESLNVVTLEDPIEYHIDGVSQSQIRNEIGYTFASGLRHVLRQDPDIIMVGEIRDSETAALATHAALTGHLVFSTIHTNNAVGVIPRLVDMGVATFLIPSAVYLMVAQRLVSRLCNYCKESFSSPSDISKSIKRGIEAMSEEARSSFKLKVQDSYKIWRSPGCNKCSRKGTMGRIGIFEALVMTPELKQIAYEDPTDLKIEQEASRQGMITLFQDGVIKALDGVISMEEIIRVLEEK